jgi:hypothetical protein
MEIALTAVLVVLTGYQPCHPSEKVCKHMAVYQDTIVKMNTQDGSHLNVAMKI